MSERDGQLYSVKQRLKDVQSQIDDKGMSIVMCIDSIESKLSDYEKNKMEIASLLVSIRWKIEFLKGYAQ